MRIDYSSLNNLEHHWGLVLNAYDSEHFAVKCLLQGQFWRLGLYTLDCQHYSGINLHIAKPLAIIYKLESFCIDMVSTI